MKYIPRRLIGGKGNFLIKATNVFDDKTDSEQKQKEADTEKLYAQIGQLKVENDFLKKNFTETTVGAKDHG